MVERVAELTDHLGFWLRAVSNHVSHGFARLLAGEGVTVAEWVLLRTLHDRPPTAPSRLADEMGLTRGAVTRLADRLIAKGLVARAADPADGRAQTLAATAAARALVPRLAALADRNDAAFFGDLTAAERGQLEAVLRRLVETHRMAALPLD